MRTRSHASLDGGAGRKRGTAEGAGSVSASPMPRVLSPAPDQMTGATQYNLQGMPPPLPGCVWGLPMLPPPVPGLVGNPMRAPGGHMMSGPSPQQRVGWQPMEASMPGMRAMPAGSVSTCMAQPPQLPPFRSCPSESPATDALTGAPAAAASAATWSHDLAETAMAGMEWDDVGMLDFDAAGDNAGLHQFSEELLGEDDDDVDGGASGSGGAAAAPAAGKPAAEPAVDLAADALSWMDEDYLLDETLGTSAVCLDMMG